MNYLIINGKIGKLKGCLQCRYCKHNPLDIGDGIRCELSPWQIWVCTKTNWFFRIKPEKEGEK